MLNHSLSNEVQVAWNGPEDFQPQVTEIIDEVLESRARGVLQAHQDGHEVLRSLKVQAKVDEHDHPQLHHKEIKNHSITELV